MRSPLDFYPTPIDVARVLKPRPGTLLLDPAAGSGQLLRAFPSNPWTAIEIDPGHELELNTLTSDVRIADALEITWPAAAVIANPAFSLLDQFWQRIAKHRAQHGVPCACFMPVAWWSAEKRRDYARPDEIVQLGWRPTFLPRAGGAHKGSQDFIWALLAPQPQPYTVWRRAERP